MIDLYKIAIEEYRFEVRLNWDRTMYYMVFNTAVISIATGLLKLADRASLIVMTAAIFLLGLLSSIVGLFAIRKGHEYYRNTVIKKSLLEDMLGLTKAVPGYPRQHTLCVGTTTGQSEHLRVLYDTDSWLSRGYRNWSIMFWITIILVVLGGINIVGIVASVALYLHPTQPANAKPPTIIPISMSDVGLTPPLASVL